jgi:hypothetical protein
VVIGAMRCGTTSLHHLLGRHPDVFMSAIKGPGLFLDPSETIRYPSKYRSNAEKRRFLDDAALLEAMSEGRRDERWFGESTDVYARHPVAGAGVPERMLRARPDVRLIYVLRDPVERILSQHRFERRKPHRPADARLAAYLRSAADPIGASRYYTQLRRFLDAGFRREQIHVASLEALRREPARALARLARFLDLPPWPRDGFEPLPHRNAGPGVPSPLAPGLREALVKALEPEVRALETWLGYGLDFPCFTGEPAAVAQASEA